MRSGNGAEGDLGGSKDVSPPGPSGGKHPCLISPVSCQCRTFLYIPVGSQCRGLDCPRPLSLPPPTSYTPLRIYLSTHAMATVPSITLAPLPSPELSDVEETSYLSVGGLGSANFIAEPLQHKLLEGRPASYERKLGDSELSYYLPSRANGVNDM